MNFGASHLGQTTAVLRKDAKRMTITLPIVHAAPKSLAEAFRLDLHSSPRSEALKNPLKEDTESFEPDSLLIELQHRQYEAAAEAIIRQLGEALALTSEEGRRYRILKTSFERFLEAFDGTAHSRSLSFSLLTVASESQEPNFVRPNTQITMGADVIHAVLGTLFVHGATTATPDFCGQQAEKLVEAIESLRLEQRVLML